MTLGEIQNKLAVSVDAFYPAVYMSPSFPGAAFHGDGGGGDCSGRGKVGKSYSAPGNYSTSQNPYSA